MKVPAFLTQIVYNMEKTGSTLLVVEKKLLLLLYRDSNYWFESTTLVIGSHKFETQKKVTVEKGERNHIRDSSENRILW